MTFLLGAFVFFPSPLPFLSFPLPSHPFCLILALKPTLRTLVPSPLPEASGQPSNVPDGKGEVSRQAMSTDHP